MVAQISRLVSARALSLVLVLVRGPAAPTWPHAQRVVSIADLHGDFERTKEILKAAGLVDANLKWTGGQTVLVQTGDITDRGDDAKHIYELFFRLADEAKAVGGGVVNLMGNHELMNLQQTADLYVSEGDYAAFGGRAEREKAWGQGGWLGDRVRNFPAIARVGDVLFVHAGLRRQFLEGGRGVDDINGELSSTVHDPELSAKAQLEHDAMLVAMVSAAELSADATAPAKPTPVIDNLDGPLWTLNFAQESPEVCAEVQEVLQRAGPGLSRMVMGHVAQMSLPGTDLTPDVKAFCGGRLIIADTAISKAMSFEGAYGVASYLEHDGHGKAVAVYPAQNGGEKHELLLFSDIDGAQIKSSDDAQGRPSEALPAALPFAVASEAVSGVEAVAKPASVIAVSSSAGLRGRLHSTGSWHTRPRYSSAAVIAKHRTRAARSIRN